MVTMITDKQIKKIWTKVDELGMTVGQLRDIVKFVSGQESTKKLTKRQGIRLIDLMEGNLQSPPPNLHQGYTSPRNSNQRRIILSPRKFPKTISGRFLPLASSKQIALIEGLKTEVGWDDEHLTNFIRKCHKVDSIPELDIKRAGQVIDMLKRQKAKQATLIGQS